MTRAERSAARPRGAWRARLGPLALLGCGALALVVAGARIELPGSAPGRDARPPVSRTAVERARSALERAHELRRSGEHGAAVDAYRALSVDPRVPLVRREEAAFWAARTAAESDGARPVRELERLAVTARAPDVALRAAGAALRSLDARAARALVEDVAAHVAERTRERTADGARWAAAIRRLRARVDRMERSAERP